VWPEEPPSPRTEITRASVVKAINAEREKRHLLPLRQDVRLDRAAEARMDEMEKSGYWGHYPPDGSNPFAWLRLNGYDYAAAAENLAKGVESTEYLISGWMGSRGHRANILAWDLNDIGVAIIEGGTTERVMGKSVIVLFGRERGVGLGGREAPKDDEPR